MTRQFTDVASRPARKTGLVVLGVCASAPIAASFFTWRVPPSLEILSAADAALVVAIGASWLLRRRRTPNSVRVVMSFGFLYCGLLAVTVAANPSLEGVIEVPHRLALIVGSLYVGATLAEIGAAHWALRLFTGTAAAVAATCIAIVPFVGIKFVPYAIGLPKNQTAGLIAVAVIVVVQRFRNMHRARAAALTALFGCALVIIGSRGAVLGLVATLTIFGWLRTRSDLVRLTIAAFGCLGIALAAGSLASDQSLSTDQDAVTTRSEFYDIAWRDWLDSPWVGQGVRYYLDPQAGYPLPLSPADPSGGRPHPHSLVLEALAESGVIGMAAWLLLLFGTLRILGSRDGPWPATALLVLSTTTIQGLVDLYWLAGLQAVPWFFIGIALAERPSLSSSLGSSEALGQA